MSCFFPVTCFFVFVFAYLVQNPFFFVFLKTAKLTNRTCLETEGGTKFRRQRRKSLPKLHSLYTMREKCGAIHKHAPNLIIMLTCFFSTSFHPPMYIALNQIYSKKIFHLTCSLSRVQQLSSRKTNYVHKQLKQTL